MYDIDNAIAQIRALPIDPRLASMDAGVMASVQSRTVRTVSLPCAVLSLAVVGSLTVGIVGAAITSPPSRASSVFPFGVPVALAPSTLLSGAE